VTPHHLWAKGTYLWYCCPCLSACLRTQDRHSALARSLTHSLTHSLTLDPSPPTPPSFALLISQEQTRLSAGSTASQASNSPRSAALIPQRHPAPPAAADTPQARRAGAGAEEDRREEGGGGAGELGGPQKMIEEETGSQWRSAFTITKRGR